MKNVLILICLLSLTACASSPDVRTASGDGIFIKMKSRDYAKLKQTEAAEMANAEYFRSQAARFQSVSDPTTQMFLIMADALKPSQRPTNHNDAEIARYNAKAQMQANWLGLGESLFKGVLGYKGLETIGDLGAAALTSRGTTINADNNSTVTGAIGEGNTYTFTESRDGIPLEPATINPITLDGPPNEGAPEVECVEVRPVLPTDPEGLDANGDGLVCSDGMGGATDN